MDLRLLSPSHTVVQMPDPKGKWNNGGIAKYEDVKSEVVFRTVSYNL